MGPICGGVCGDCGGAGSFFDLERFKRIRLGSGTDIWKHDLETPVDFGSPLAAGRGRLIFKI